MELGSDHQSLVPGQWHLEVISQVLFHASRWEHKVREVLKATRELHQIQVRVVELLDEFSWGLEVLDMHSLYLVAVNAQAHPGLQPEPGGPYSGASLSPLVALSHPPLHPAPHRPFGQHLI